MSEHAVPRPFWNDGGPLLIVPQTAVPLWEGTDVPTAGRTVEARTRWSDAGAPACDYDRACDVDPESAAALGIGDSWGVVLGTAAAQWALWLPSARASEFYAVGVEAADDTTPGRLRALAETPGEWRVLRSRAAVGPDGLLLAHAASRLAEVRELPALASKTDAEVEAALIGDGLRFHALAGDYTVSARDVTTPAGEYLTFVRFNAVPPAP